MTRGLEWVALLAYVCRHTGLHLNDEHCITRNKHWSITSVFTGPLFTGAEFDVLSVLCVLSDGVVLCRINCAATTEAGRD